jgi:hypothetical protein
MALVYARLVGISKVVAVKPERSVHDNNIYGYSVDCEERRVVLHTVSQGLQSVEYTDIVFGDVFAHHFEHVLEGNILFDVDEIDLARFVNENAEMFSQSWRYGWPRFEYHGDLTKLANLMQAASARVFAVNSSYGLSGWVVALSSECVEREGLHSFS